MVVCEEKVVNLPILNNAPFVGGLCNRRHGGAPGYLEVIVDSETALTHLRLWSISIGYTLLLGLHRQSPRLLVSAARFVLPVV
jgi:hypothetical protein